MTETGAPGENGKKGIERDRLNYECTTAVAAVLGAGCNAV